MTNIGYLLLKGGLSLVAIFTAAWLVQLRTKNAAIVDVVWSASFPILALIYFVSSTGYLPRQLLLLVMVVIWGLRLASYLFIRTMGHEEDARYGALRKSWGARQNLMMLRFFIFQAILSVLLSFPFALIMVNGNLGLEWIELIGAGIWLIGVIGESAADFQLKRFKSGPDNKGKICNAGLWYYSRHPNYFFEWVIWISFFITALGSPWGFLSLVCPLLILYFLLKVTGIPYTEVQMVKSRGEAYIEYQRTTSAFLPLPKKNVV